MNIRVESDHDSLKEIHLALYQATPTSIVHEDYQSTPGMQREPILTAIITSATSIALAVIKAWIDDRKNKQSAEIEKQKTDIEREKVRLAYDLAKTKLILQQDSRVVVELPADQIDKIPMHLLPQQGDASS